MDSEYQNQQKLKYDLTKREEELVKKEKIFADKMDELNRMEKSLIDREKALAEKETLLNEREYELNESIANKITSRPPIPRMNEDVFDNRGSNTSTNTNNTGIPNTSNRYRTNIEYDEDDEDFKIAMENSMLLK
jgi:hypothetical protein